MNKKLSLILHNIRSSYNIGAIFRTADGAGVEKIYLSGYTMTPYDEKNEAYPTRAQKMLAKTALGAEKEIPWEKVESIDDLIDNLRKKKIKIAALEQSKNSVDIKKYKPGFPLALILGNEVEGLEGKILEKADVATEIPMRGKKESLNVSVAAGIAIYHILE